MSYIKGKFKHIIFESESGYRVGLFKVNETDDENIPTNKLITYTGYFMKTNDNDNYVSTLIRGSGSNPQDFTFTSDTNHIRFGIYDPNGQLTYCTVKAV